MFDPLYRLRQLASAASAGPLNRAEQARVRAVLDEPAFALFQTMRTGDQRHSLKLLDALVAEGYTARPLLQAALLHDVAKRSVGLGYRAAVVGLNWVAPGALARVASSNPASWRYPFYVALHHPELGAELAARAGVQEPALALIRTHQMPTPRFEPPQPPILPTWHHALKALDDVN